MVRSEFIVAGCILALLCFVLLFEGYDRIQPSAAEKVVSVVEQLSGEKAPAALHPPKTAGYTLLIVGCLSFGAGLALIMTSRMPRNDNQNGEM
jgi:hypothetical protein